MKIHGFVVLRDSVPVTMELDGDIVGGLEGHQVPFPIFSSREDAEETAKGYIGSGFSSGVGYRIAPVSVELSVDKATDVKWNDDSDDSDSDD